MDAAETPYVKPDQMWRDLLSTTNGERTLLVLSISENGRLARCREYLRGKVTGRETHVYVDCLTAESTFYRHEPGAAPPPAEPAKRARRLSRHRS